MKTSHIPLLIVIVATQLCTGCSSEALPTVEKPIEKPTHQAALTVDVQMDTPQTGRAVVTGNAFSHESMINVLLVDAQAGESAYENAQLPYILKDPNSNGGAWVPSTESGLEVKEAEAQVYAHYPDVLPLGSSIDLTKRSLVVDLPLIRAFGKMEEFNSENTLWLEFVAGEGEKEVLFSEAETDYMTGVGTNVTAKAPDQKATTIRMKHALSMVVIKAYKVPENTAPGHLKEITFSNRVANRGPLKKGSFSLANNQFTSDPSAFTSYTCTMEGYPLETYYAMMVYPATITSNEVVMTVKVDQSIYTIPVPAKMWQSGKIILYHLKLNATNIELTQPVGLIDWSEIKEYPFTLE